MGTPCRSPRIGHFALFRGEGWGDLLLCSSWPCWSQLPGSPLQRWQSNPEERKQGRETWTASSWKPTCPSGPQRVQPRCLDPTWPTLSGRARYRPRSWPAQDQWPLAPRSHPSTQEMQELFSLSSAHPGRDGGGASASGRPRRRAGLGGPTPRLDKRLRLRPARAVNLDWRLTGPQS